MWGIMKKFIVLFLLSVLSQNLNAADWLVDSGRKIPICGVQQSCHVGTDDWERGGGGAPPQSAEDIYQSWLATAAGKEYVRKNEEKQRKKVELAIID